MSAARRVDPGPAETLAGLEAELRQSEPRRAYLLRGEERYFRERAIQALRAQAEPRGWEITRHDAESGNPDYRLNVLVEDLSGGGGLFAPHRMIVVRHPEEILRAESDGEGPFLCAARSFLEAGESGGSLVLSAGSMRADSVLAKAIVAAGGAVLSFRRLYPSPPPWNPDPRRAELVQWTLARAREFGLRMGPENAVYLCAAVGNDLFTIEGELSRLRDLPEEDLREVVEWQSSSPPWTVAETLVQGDLARALAGIETLFKSGFQDRGRKLVDAAALATMTISTLGREVRRSLALATAMELGADPEATAEALGVKGKGRELLIARSRRVPAVVWREREEEVAGLERRAKSGAPMDANDFVALALRWARGSAGSREGTRTIRG